jgi:hypothetical protein
MGKFYDVIGFLDEVETVPDVWTPGITERYYSGDTLPNYIRNDSNDINDSVVLNYKFRILADTYALNHMQDIRYVQYLNSKWKVTNVEPDTPRLIITVGGVYNEQDET